MVLALFLVFPTHNLISRFIRRYLDINTIYPRWNLRSSELLQTRCCWIKNFADSWGTFCGTTWNEVCVKQKILAKPQWMKWNCGLVMQGFHNPARERNWTEVHCITGIHVVDFICIYYKKNFCNTRFWKNLRFKKHFEQNIRICATF